MSGPGRPILDEKLPTPTFIIIGAQRSATRWLRANLEEHPDIFTPSVSKPFFADQRPERSYKTYLRQFSAWEGEPAVGESSPSYLLPSNGPTEIAERIKARLPEVRLIAVVRDPIERMYSAVLHHIKRGRLPADVDLFSMVIEQHPDVEELDLVSGGLYAANLRPFVDRFGDQMLIVFQDDARDDPAALYRRVLTHIGADPSFQASRLDQVLFSNRRSVRATGARLTSQQRRVLYMLFRADVEELEAMTGRFVPAWDPGPPPAGWRDLLPDVVVPFGD